MWKDKIKDINWFQVVVIVMIFIVALIIDSKINAKTNIELKELKENYVAMKDQNDALETKLQNLTNEQIEFEIKQEEKNNAYEKLFANQDAINESANELMKIIIGY